MSISVRRFIEEQLYGDTNTAIKTEDTIRFDNMKKCANHAFWAIRGASLEADLEFVSEKCCEYPSGWEPYFDYSAG